MNKTITDAISSVAKISYLTSEYSAIYPITPSSTIGEIYSKKSEKGELNIFNNIPKVDVMQSELGAISACNGALNSGLYSTTFTSSQGLLLMIPNMYKLASSLKPFVLTVSSRSLSTHALNIFCDHSDVMATRQTGFIQLNSSNTQKAEDFSMLANMITLKSKIPVLHFFDGFITSHKIDTIDGLTTDNVKNLFPYKEFYEYKQSCLNNVNPKTLGTNQNPDIYFQNRERIEEYYKKLPIIFEECFDRFFKETGRRYNVFDYYGSKKATKIIVSMGSSTETLKECLTYLGDDYGVISVNVFNPFIEEEFLKVLPKTTKVVTVLDRTKEAGLIKQPLAQNVISSLNETNIKVLSGIYGLGGKNFDLSHAYSCFKNMNNNLKDNFTVGIIDDINHTSLDVENKKFENDIFKIGIFGVGNDGSVSSTKTLLKIIGSNTDNFVSGNFYYDSKKSGNLTESTMLVSKNKIELNYKVNDYDLLVINDINLINNYNLLNNLKENSTILLNCGENLNNILSNNVKINISKNNCKLYQIDANKLVTKYNLGNKINLIMAVSLLSLVDFINLETAIKLLKQESKKLYNADLDYLDEINLEVDRFLYPNSWKDLESSNNLDNEQSLIVKNLGHNIPVSYFNANGQDNLTNTHIPLLSKNKACWNSEKCIQCTNCSLICPHSAIKIKLVSFDDLKNAPNDFKFIKNKDNTAFCLYVDKIKCTGCGNCIKICPTSALSLSENLNYDNKEFFESLKNIENAKTLNNIAFNTHYYNCNTSCTACSEIAYFKLLGSMFGSHLVLSNATGCSSIYNGSVGCSPFTKDCDGFGTSFVSNLFEDNFEFGYGLTFGYNEVRNNLINFACENINNFSDNYREILTSFIENKDNFKLCKEIYLTLNEQTAKNSFDEHVKNHLSFIIPSIHFITGGDGFAYDIDFSGLDHICAMNKNVNILILDNELYSNTGGQTSKATNLGSASKYTNSKQTKKKDLFLSLLQYDNLYFSKVCLGANKNQCIKAFNDAVNHNGPSIIVAYTPCINHKIKMENSIVHQQNAVKCGYFNLMTYNNGALTLDSTPNFDLFESFILSEGRYKNISKEDLINLKQQKISSYEFYKKLQTVLNNDKA